GGDFTAVGTKTQNRIARLLPDGSLDESFNTAQGANGKGAQIAIQTDGQIVVAGDFCPFRGQGSGRIGRLKPGGTPGPSVNPGTGASGSIYTIRILEQGTILVGGLFPGFNGGSQPFFVRLKSDGTVDTTFNPVMSAAVRAVAVDSDGNILVGGDFTRVNGLT